MLPLPITNSFLKASVPVPVSLRPEVSVPLQTGPLLKVWSIAWYLICFHQLVRRRGFFYWCFRFFSRNFVLLHFMFLLENFRIGNFFISLKLKKKIFFSVSFFVFLNISVFCCIYYLRMFFEKKNWTMVKFFFYCYFLRFFMVCLFFLIHFCTFVCGAS